MKESIIGSILVVALIFTFGFSSASAIQEDYEIRSIEYYENIVSQLEEEKQCEIEYLARLAFAEARGESFEGIIAVCNVVINRRNSDHNDFKNQETIIEVIDAPGQFTNVPSYKRVKIELESYEKCYKAACVAVIFEVKIVPNYVCFFQMGKRKTHGNRPYVMTIGCHHFYGQLSDAPENN